MQRFVEFNAQKFIRESGTWEQRKKDLLQELDGITEIRGVDNSPVRSGKLNDSTANVAMQRDRIQHQIERIEEYEAILQYAFGRLSDEQKEVIQLFFYSRGYIARLVRKFAGKYHISEREVYRRRREALTLISQIITDRFL